MPNSNEFKGATLVEAVRKATAAEWALWITSPPKKATLLLKPWLSEEHGLYDWGWAISSCRLTAPTSIQLIWRFQNSRRICEKGCTEQSTLYGAPSAISAFYTSRMSVLITSRQLDMPQYDRPML